MPLFNGKILVTGATGLVGTAVALEIAKAGFAVRATSRSWKRANAWSEKYPGANVEWYIVEDQKTGRHVYDEAVQGVDGICHVAGPFTLDHTDGQEIINIQRNGTMGILEAAIKEPKVKRIVYTSTVAAIHQDPHLGTGLGKTYTDDDWNPTSWEKGTQEPHHPATSYCCGKTLAERDAWAFMQDRKPHFDFVALCPATGYGPPMQVLESLEDLDTASERLWHHISHALEHKPLDSSPSFTNVRDTADAQLKALTWPIAGGKRYQLVSGPYSYARIFAILKKGFPDQAHRFPDIPDDGLPIQPSLWTDCSKVKNELSMRFRTLEETILEEGEVLFALEAKSAAKRT